MSTTTHVGDDPNHLYRERSGIYEGYVVARAVVRTMRDSTRTNEIHKVEEITGRRRTRHWLESMRGDPEVELLLRERPELSSAQVDFDALRRLPGSTLGGAYVRHLDDNGLTADYQAARTHYVEDPDISYLIRRFRQTHDVWHALTGLGTTGHEEVIIHAFSWGQMRLPVSAMVVLLGSLKHIVLERRRQALRHGLYEAYANGRDAQPLLPVFWETLWDEPLEAVRQRYNVRPCTRAYVDG